ncbi:MAG: type II toxin-antitoxin system VapC family toxin [Chloracidobacterium sp.]|nr:type II toxin-antitoxin system VapC family toxin [Chloracidobacterium sp.]
MLNLDTNILLATVNDELKQGEEELIRGGDLAISDVVLWELAKLVQLKRIRLDLDGTVFKRVLRQLTVYPITLEIARQSTALDFRSDPADEIIAATSVVEGMPLLTRDRKILKSRLVPIAR